MRLSWRRRTVRRSGAATLSQNSGGLKPLRDLGEREHAPGLVHDLGALVRARYVRSVSWAGGKSMVWWDGDDFVGLLRHLHLAEHQADGLALTIERSTQIGLAAPDLHVAFVHAPQAIARSPMRACQRLPQSASIPRHRSGSTSRWWYDRPRRCDPAA